MIRQRTAKGHHVVWHTDRDREETEMADIAKVIECPCGAMIEGSSDADVVAKARDHAKSTHDMDLSEEQALSMARPA